MKISPIHVTCPYLDCGIKFEVPVNLRLKGHDEGGDMELRVIADTSEIREHVSTVHQIVTTWAMDEIIQMGME